MIVVTVIIALFAIAAVVALAKVLSDHSQKGWEAAHEAEASLRAHMVARITTLENRLLSHSWQDFANLQLVPDETAKASWNPTEPRTPESFGVRPEEMAASQARNQGADLEPEAFEGPTIG